MTAAPLPVYTRWLRARLAFGRMPFRARASFYFLALVFLTLAAGNLLGWAQRQPLGGPCARDVECRSQKCLHLLGRGDFVVHGTGGVCTEDCARDLDCPNGFVCVEAELRPEWSSPLLTRGTPARACARP
jgi:hypothetical protein